MKTYIMIGIGLWLTLARSPLSAAVPYCNITDIITTEMSNGVQLAIKADGVLMPGDEGWRSGRAQTIKVKYYNAKSQLGKSFIDISSYPVSYVEVTTPQGAEEGIGVQLTISCYAECRYEIRSTTDQTSFIITVFSERTLEKLGKKSTESSAKKTEEELTVEFENNLLTVKCLKADIHELMGQIAAKTGLNLTLDDGVKREVSLNLMSLPVEDVIKGIASAYGLALSNVDGIYMMSDGVPIDLPSYRLSGTTSFPLKYTRASEASGLLPTFLYSYLHVNQPQNALVVSAPSQMLDKIDGDLKEVDVAPPQVMIEALAVEFASVNDLDQVVETRYGDVLGVGDLSGLTDAQRDPLLQGFTSSRTGEIRFSTLAQFPSDFQARIRALETKGRARIHAAPRMAAMNGYPANIFIGLRRFIRVQFLSGGLTQEQIQGVDVGVKLAVTPWTGGDGEITVAVAPEVSNVSEIDLQTGLPVLSKRSASTKVRVKDGETIVIGGLTQRQEFETRSKVPVLGDLPLIGGLFRSKSRSQTDSELVVFVTPHLLTAECRLPDDAKEREIRKKFLVPSN